MVRVDDNGANLGPTIALPLQSCKNAAGTSVFAVAGMRSWFLALVVVAAWCGPAVAQEDRRPTTTSPRIPTRAKVRSRKRPSDCCLFAAEIRGSSLPRRISARSWGNVSGRIKRGAVYEGRLNLAVDVDLQKLVGAEQLTFHAEHVPDPMAAGLREAPR